MQFNLSNYGLLKINGIDANKLLQGQLTCDIEKVNETTTCMGALCNPQGRIISLFHLFMLDSTYYLLMPRNLIPITENALRKYSVFYKTELTNVSARYRILGCNQATPQSQCEGLIQIPWSKTRTVWVSEVPDSQKNSGNEEAVKDSHCWLSLNIRDGIPTIYPETTEKFLPHDLHLHKLGALNFNKGCYTGQEIIARMHYRAKLKNHLYAMHIKSDLPFSPGDTVYYFKDQCLEVGGTVVDVTSENNANYDALVITDETNALDNHLFLHHDHHHFFSMMV